MFPSGLGIWAFGLSVLWVWLGVLVWFGIDGLRSVVISVFSSVWILQSAL